MAASRIGIVAVIIASCHRSSGQAPRVLSDASTDAQPAHPPTFADPLIQEPWPMIGRTAQVVITHELSRGRVANVDRVVAGMKAGFRACYARGLATNPTLEGDLRIVAEIGSRGEVIKASPEGGDGPGPEVVSCVVRRVQSATFVMDEASGAGATLRIRATFEQR